MLLLLAGFAIPSLPSCSPASMEPTHPLKPRQQTDQPEPPRPERESERDGDTEMGPLTGPLGPEKEREPENASEREGESENNDRLCCVVCVRHDMFGVLVAQRVCRRAKCNHTLRS